MCVCVCVRERECVCVCECSNARTEVNMDGCEYNLLQAISLTSMGHAVAALTSSTPTPSAISTRVISPLAGWASNTPISVMILSTQCLPVRG